MIENVNGVKKVDVFNDIVSRLEDSKKAKVSDDVVSGMKNYYSNKQEYRGRVNLLADNLKGVKPIDSEINNVIYLSNYMEKGIAIKSSIISFKQIWVEYRLIYNENTYKENNITQTQKNNEQSNIEKTFNVAFEEQNNFNLPSYEPNVEPPNTFNIPNYTEINTPKYEEFNTFNIPSFDNNIEKTNTEIPTFDLPSLEQNKPILKEYDFQMPEPTNYNFNGLNINQSVQNNSLETINDALEGNYKKLYNKVLDLNKYIENFNKKKIDLDRQIASLEEKRKALTSELNELENAKKEFSRYKNEEEQKINNMKNEVNNKVVSLQNLIDNLDNILGKIN